MPENMLEVGKITSVFGIKGEVKVQPWCDSPERARVQKNMAILKIEGVDDANEAQKLRNHVLYMDRADVELEEGSYFIADLIGLEVYDSASGERYGKLTDVTETGANDVYHITAEDGRELLIPAIPQVIDSIDLEEKVMKITPLDGLFDI